MRPRRPDSDFRYSTETPLTVLLLVCTSIGEIRNCPRVSSLYMLSSAFRAKTSGSYSGKIPIEVRESLA